MNYELWTIILFIFWTLFWSFASVLIYRLKSGEKWIMCWRSHCPKCNKNLKFYDLFPIFSWLSTFWKCRYCKEKISIIYPALELSMWIIFALVWVYLIDFDLILSWDLFEIIRLFFWLSISFITIIYIFYDILFLEIHEWVMFSGIFLAFIWIFTNSVLNIWVWESLIIGLFWIIVLAIFYLIMIKELSEIIDFLLLFWVILVSVLAYSRFPIIIENPIFSGIIWALGIFIFFYLQIFLSRWKALWWWDLRIGIMIWLLLWISNSFLWIVSAYLIWTFIWIFIIIKNWKKSEPNIVPFWPFLWAWFFVAIFFSEVIKSYSEKFLLIM